MEVIALYLGEQQLTATKPAKAAPEAPPFLPKRPWITPESDDPPTEEEVKQHDRDTMHKIVRDCTGIPEAIKAILAAGFTQRRIGELLDIDQSSMSKAANGKIFPFVDRAFRQHFQIPPAAAGEEISAARARHNAIHEEDNME